MDNSDKILEYCKNFSIPDEKILDKLSQFTHTNIEASNMISGSMVGNLLYVLARAIKAKKVLDVGMFTGYSAIKLASAIPNNGEVHTFEIAKNHIEIASKFFNESDYKNIIIHEGSAIDNLENLPVGEFDFAFIDADKISYIDYYRRCLVLLKAGGIIVLDNMLWGGKVLEPDDDDSIALHKTAKLINGDDRVFNMMLNIRDGLMVCMKNG